MTELQSSQRRTFTAKTIFGLLLAVVMVAAFATAGSAEGPPRSGHLLVTKECSEFTGLPGGFCTITGSNLNGIAPGMKVIYSDPHLVFPNLISNLSVDGLGNNDVSGYVSLNVVTWIGSLRLSGGTGEFRGFHADNLVVDCTPAGSPCTWEGTYYFTPPGHDQ
jgi:hypothetical protein